MTEAVREVPESQDQFDEPINEVGELSQWTLIRMRFARNRLAMLGLFGMVAIYIIVFIGPFLAPNEYTYQNKDYVFGPPSKFTFTGPDGRIGIKPYMFATTTLLNPDTFKFEFAIDEARRLPLKFFTKGDKYTLLGFIHSDVHLIGVDKPYRVYILGADGLGRDMFARILLGGQISTTIGLVGVALSVVIGAVLGTASGFFGGLGDDIIQRIIEIIQSFPTIPLWAGLGAALPPVSDNFTAMDRYFLITVVLSLVSWTGLARQLRAKVMAYRSADFSQAALAAGSSDARIILTHMLPNAASHIIVTSALAVPNMILGETALSFLGLGILPPMVSWGALLRDAQQISVIVQHPWIMVPGVAVVITVLLFSFLGDGLRDAVDPYSI